MKNELIYLLTFLAVFLPVLWFVFFGGKNQTARKPVKQDKEDQPPALFRFSAVPVQILNAAGVGTLICRLFPAKCRALRKRLTYAGLSITAEQVYATRIFLIMLLTPVLGGIVYLLIDDENQFIATLLASLAGVFIASFLPGVIIGNLVQARKTKILQTLPYSIDLIASAMRGGLDFSAAILFYVKLGIKGPLTDEYSMMLREMELGVIRTAALENMADRIQIKEFTSFASAIVMGTELGASLAETMEIQGEEMRKLRFSIAECKAQRAPSLMLLPMALFILPAVFIIILTPVFLKMQEAGVPLF